MQIQTRNVDLSNINDEKANTYGISLAVILLTIGMAKFNKGFFAMKAKEY